MAHPSIVPPDEQAESVETSAAPLSGQARSSVRASLRLNFERRDDPDLGALTVLKSSLQEPPLRVVRAFDHADGSALVHLHNVSGGLLGGDQLSLDVNLARDSRVQLTTTGATRIYRPRANAAPAIQTTNIVVEQNALLEYVPDQLIPFAGSRYAQHTQIHLEEGAGLFWWEVVAPGREASGESFAYDKLEISSNVTAKNRLIAAERVRLEPVKHAANSSARLGQCRTWATFYICKVGLPQQSWIELENHLREAAAQLTPSSETLWGISTLPAHGLAVRGLAIHGRELHTGLHALWRAAKIYLYGLTPVAPRKVN